MALFVKRNTRKILVCSKVVYHTGVFSQGTGLMLHRKIHDEAHIFPFAEKKKITLTMWFVFFPIDVIYLDGKKSIVEIKENFRPFTNHFPKKESVFVVELPAGIIKKMKLKVKETVDF